MYLHLPSHNYLTSPPLQKQPGQASNQSTSCIIKFPKSPHCHANTMAAAPLHNINSKPVLSPIHHHDYHLNTTSQFPPPSCTYKSLFPSPFLPVHSLYLQLRSIIIIIHITIHHHSKQATQQSTIHPYRISAVILHHCKPRSPIRHQTRSH